MTLSILECDKSHQDKSSSIIENLQQYTDMIILQVLGIIHIIAGVIALFDPSYSTSVFNLVLDNKTTTIEILAIYGGLSAAIGVLFLYCGINATRTIDGLKICVLLYTTVGLVRLFGLLFYGFDDYNTAIMIFELGVACIAIVLMSVGRKV